MMITYQLIHEHNEALIDASHQSALLGLESCRRLSHYSLASLRDILNQGGTDNAPPAVVAFRFAGHLIRVAVEENTAEKRIKPEGIRDIVCPGAPGKPDFHFFR